MIGYILPKKTSIHDFNAAEGTKAAGFSAQRFRSRDGLAGDTSGGKAGGITGVKDFACVWLARMAYIILALRPLGPFFFGTELKVHSRSD